MSTLTQESVISRERVAAPRTQLRRLRKLRFALSLGSVLLGIHLLIAAAAPLIAPYSPTQFNVSEVLKPPSRKHPFGTDQFGRDIFSRVVFGSRSILTLSVAATLFSLAAGTIIGLFAGYVGGVVDEIIMRLMDTLLAIPAMLLALLIVTMLGGATINLILGIGIVFTPRVARVVRSGVLGVTGLGYVEAARLRGEKVGYILLWEILPNIREILVVEGSLRFGYAILLGASLGFLGLGIQPPTPDWGLMISEARNLLAYAPWTVAFPSIAIGTLVVGTNLLSDALSREVWGAEAGRIGA